VKASEKELDTGTCGDQILSNSHSGNVCWKKIFQTMGKDDEHCVRGFPPSTYRTDTADHIPLHTRMKRKINLVHTHLEAMKTKT